MKRFKFLAVMLAMLAGVGLLTSASCSEDDDDSPSSSSIVGTWVDDENNSQIQSYWTFKSNGDFESHLYSSFGDQPRYGTYVLNNGVLNIKIRAIQGNNGAYTSKYIVTTLTKSSLVIVGDDEFKSFTKK